MGEYRYQHAKADGNLDWTVGRTSFRAGYNPVFDQLRFHRGDGFTIQRRPDPAGEGHPLGEIDDRLEPRLQQADPDTVFIIRSKEDHFGMAMRRHLTPVELTVGEEVVGDAVDLIGTPYHFGYTDCSWLTQRTYGEHGVDLPHNAAMQRQDSDILSINRGQIKIGDLLFHHNDDHVSEYYGMYRGYECVIDTEPSDTGAPWGGDLGTGVQIRPMKDGYYCDWANVNGIGRALVINGKP